MRIQIAGNSFADRAGRIVEPGRTAAVWYRSEPPILQPQIAAVRPIEMKSNRIDGSFRSTPASGSAVPLTVPAGASGTI
jgi:hypothetical protein